MDLKKNEDEWTGIVETRKNHNKWTGTVELGKVKMNELERWKLGKLIGKVKIMKNQWTGTILIRENENG